MMPLAMLASCLQRWALDQMWILSEMKSKGDGTPSLVQVEIDQFQSGHFLHVADALGCHCVCAGERMRADASGCERRGWFD